MNEQQRTALKQQIAATLERTRVDIRRLEDLTQPIGPDDSIGRISRMDAINNKSVTEAGLRQARRKLDALKRAATKVDQTGFGRCTRCGHPIQPKRLMFLPESTHCVRCAR